MTETIIIRPSFEDDFERALDSALRFSQRHGLHIDTLEEAKALHYTLRGAQLHLLNQVQMYADSHRTPRLSRLWRACFRRAVSEPSATGFGGIRGERIVETRRMK